MLEPLDLRAVAVRLVADRRPRHPPDPAARAALLDRVGLKDQIDQVVSTMSGGQRQRLAIARALYKDAPVLILDEATSSVDTETEQEIQRALDNLVQGRTTIAIAHRLSTLHRADRLVVLEQGQLVEEGQHDELMARQGAYWRLYEAQARQAEADREAMNGARSHDEGDA